MQKVAADLIAKYILDHPTSLLWYRFYLKKKHNLPFFTLTYSYDLRQKGVPVDMTRDGDVILLIPVYTPYGVSGSDIRITVPQQVSWYDGDFAFWGNWKFYSRFAWMVAINRKHPLRKYVISEIKKEEKIRGSGKT